MIHRLHHTEASKASRASSGVSEDRDNDKSADLDGEFSELLEELASRGPGENPDEGLSAAIAAAGALAPRAHVEAPRPETTEKPQEDHEDEERHAVDADSETDVPVENEAPKKATNSKKEPEKRDLSEDGESEQNQEQPSTEEAETPVRVCEGGDQEVVSEQLPTETATTSEKETPTEEASSEPFVTAAPVQGETTSAEGKVAQSSEKVAKAEVDKVKEVAQSTASSEDVTVGQTPAAPAEQVVIPQSTGKAPTPETKKSDTVKEAALAAPVTPSATETSIQSTLLRQAFEAVKAAATELRSQFSGSQTQSSPNAIAGLNASSNARADFGAKSQKPLSRVQVFRMMERVESVLKDAVRSKDGKTLSFKLEPSELGKVKVDVSLREGTLHARLTPENDQVTAAIRERAHELQASLRKLGLNVDTVSVTVRGEEGESFSSFANGNGGNSFQDNRNNMPGDATQTLEKTFGNEVAVKAKSESEDDSNTGGLGTGRTRRQGSERAEHWVA